MLTTFQLITLDYWENIYNMVSPVALRSPRASSNLRARSERSASSGRSIDRARRFSRFERPDEESLLAPLGFVNDSWKGATGRRPLRRLPLERRTRSLAATTGR